MEKKKKKKNISLKGYFKNSDGSGNDDHHYSINTIDQNYMNPEEKKSSKNLFSKSPIGLVAYYRCTEGKSKKLGDLSGCGRIAHIKNDGNSSDDSPWMFKIKNKEILNLDNLKKKHKKNYCLNVSGQSNWYIEIPSDNCLELLGGNYSTNEKSINIKKEICKDISNDINEGFTFEMWIGIKEKKIKKKKEKKSFCLIQKGIEYSEWGIYLIIDDEKCRFLIKYKNQNFEFDKFPIAHLKTIKFNNYYWSYISIVFNMGIDLIFVILSGDNSYFFNLYKNKYAIFYNNSLYPTNFFPDSKNIVPICIGKYNSHLNNLGDIIDKKNNKENYEICSFLVTEIRLFAVSRSADLVIEQYNQPLEFFSNISIKSETYDKSDNIDNDKILKSDSNNNSENGYYKFNSSDGSQYCYNDKHDNTKKKEKQTNTQQMNINGNKINKSQNNTHINDENIYKSGNSFFENYNKYNEESDNKTIEYKFSEFNNEIEEMKKKFSQFNDEIKGMDINNERFSFGSENNKGKKKKKSKKHESDNDSHYENCSSNSNRKFTKYSFENNSKFIKNEDSSSNDLDVSKKSQTFYDDNKKSKKEKRESRKEMKKNIHIDEVMSPYLNAENYIDLKNNNISFFNFSDEDIANKNDGNDNDNNNSDNNSEWKKNKESRNKLNLEKNRNHNVNDKDSKFEEKLQNKKSNSFHNVRKINKDDKINMDEIINEINKTFENKIFNVFVDKWAQNLGVSQNDRDKFLENLKKQRDFIDLEKKKKNFNNNEESKNSDMDRYEYDDIKRKYNELIEKKELEKKKKIQENLKEEIKKLREQSPAEKGLNEFIKKNKKMNEYYVKKYRILSQNSRKSNTPINDIQSNSEKSNNTNESNIDNSVNANLKRENSIDEFFNFENIKYMNKKSDNSFDSYEFTFSKRDFKDENFGEISEKCSGSKKNIHENIYEHVYDSTKLTSFEENALEHKENKKDLNKKADREINIGKKYYRYIWPLTHYEIYIIKNVHKYGINKELKQFKNNNYMENDKYKEDKRISRNSININYIKYKISMMKYLNNMSLKYILEKKYTKSLKACIKNKNYIHNFINSYCTIQNRVLKENYKIVNICLKVNYSKNITIDELKTIIKNNVINIIVCKIFILIYEYKRYKYIENSSRILVLLSVLCRILYISYELNNRSNNIDKLLKKVLKKFIIRLFLRGCLYYVEKICEYFFKLYPCDFIKFEKNDKKEEDEIDDPIQTNISQKKNSNNNIIHEIYQLSKNTFLKYAISYKSNKCSLINNHEMDFENSIKTFSPEWGYYIYSTSNFNIFSSSIKYNGFLKSSLDISILISNNKYESFLTNNPMCIRDVNELENSEFSKLNKIEDDEISKLNSDKIKEGKGKDTIDSIEDNDQKICLSEISNTIVPLDENAENKFKENGDILCKIDIKKNNNISLIDYLTNYEKKMKNYYIIDDTLKTIKFNRKQTNYNLENFFNNHNISSNINFTDKTYFQNFMKKVNYDAFLNTSKYSYKNKELFGICPHCKKQLRSFSNVCDSCHKRIFICYYFFVYCTYKYRCQLCDATYSEMCMKKFKMGFTCLYCGLFFVKK
ncbi:conserved Plasmodium protein, unknown function [Plasmodium berghei]|uniref:Uncharacterized protein n=2 Tax=Plasmodium berghei TaxID=5821 RepID=A0A509ADW1_PLABA|nr:conserved Plasmodium protein, unknown function [Plasmodium berghei ANKA]SCM19183.1 conserved Plasmodium protein, unknown function [Plasmodium berghei]SCN21634.1 conserved Plasmodium protein, unknown function [Plasmodium berghei]SCO58878.1 conserved Plasmodium protein, unknown function [Plasmodium berghei]SCO58951.1 conserved Plasmodium protein, unknown function [Plasmodium berghei]VUC53818.1 conserved Plasmodium protein, unknown function [Plasmodium berghei ANKA]|eukprot:XP_034419682.1 conserved Plasmodium protein, unknown function [Plasmodium berghei ANKA]